MLDAQASTGRLSVQRDRVVTVVRQPKLLIEPFPKPRGAVPEFIRQRLIAGVVRHPRARHVRVIDIGLDLTQRDGRLGKTAIGKIDAVPTSPSSPD
jgi:hypothetical protein